MQEIGRKNWTDRLQIMKTNTLITHVGVETRIVGVLGSILDGVMMEEEEEEEDYWNHLSHT